MACSLNLYDTLPTPKQVGGVWSEITPALPTYGSQGGIISGGYLGTITIPQSNTFAAKNYIFEYSLTQNGCTSKVTSTITVKEGGGLKIIIGVCACTSSINLMDLIQNQRPDVDQGGSWSGDVSDPGYNAGGSQPDDDTYTPPCIGGVTRHFFYNIPDNPDCSNCTTEIEIYVAPAPPQGISCIRTFTNPPVTLNLLTTLNNAPCNNPMGMPNGGTWTVETCNGNFNISTNCPATTSYICGVNGPSLGAYGDNPCVTFGVFGQWVFNYQVCITNNGVECCTVTKLTIIIQAV